MLEHRCAALESMCRLRRAAAKDATGPVALWQRGNFFPGRSKDLQYSAGPGRRAVSSAPCTEAAWRYTEKTATLPCRWGGGRKRRSAQVYRPSEAAASHGQGIIWPAQLPARQRPLHRLQARNFLRRNGHRQQSEGVPVPQTRANSANSPESVFCLNRLALQSIRLSCRGKNVFSARFRPDGAVPHLAFSLFQRQNAPAGSKREFFACRSQDAGPCPVDRGTKPLPNAGTPQFRHDGRQQGARFTALTPAMWSNFPLASGKTRQHSARDQCAAVFPLRG